MTKIESSGRNDGIDLADPLKHLVSDNVRIDYIRQTVKKIAVKEGRRPRILFSNIDDFRFAKKLAVAFGSWGFDVDIGPISQTPEQAARMAVENDVHILCYVGHSIEFITKRLIDALTKEAGQEKLVTVIQSDPEDKSDSFYRIGNTGELLIDKTITQTVLRILEQIKNANDQ